MVVISVTDEPASLVGPWIAKHGVTHPVVCLPNGDLEEVIGVSGFPTSAVFLGMEMTWTGRPSASGSPLSAAKKKGRKDSLYPKKLAKIVKSMNARESAKALKMLRAAKPKLKGRDADWAERLDTFMLSTSELDFAAATAAIEEGYWFKGTELMTPYLAKDSLFPGAETAQEQLTELSERPLYSKEILGGKLFLEAKKLAEAQEYSDAVKAYKSILKKCGEAEISKHARSAGQALIDAGQPGYKPSCERCRKRKQGACEKHAEEMKL